MAWVAATPASWSTDKHTERLMSALADLKTELEKRG
jgi:hypothetical protein